VVAAVNDRVAGLRRDIDKEVARSVRKVPSGLDLVVVGSNAM
jgi:hypothetical protein